MRTYAWASPVQPSRSSRCGAVGGNVDEVHLLRPPGVLRELVQHRVATPEGAGLRRRAADRDGDDLVWRRSVPETRDLQVAEAVEGEAGLPFLHPLAAEGVGVGRPRRAQVRGVGRTVGVQRLDEPHLDAPSGLAFRLEAREPREVLAEVEHVAAALRGDLDRPQARVGEDRLAGKRLDLRGNVGGEVRGAGGRESGTRDVGLAREEVLRDGPSRGGAPGPVGPDRLPRAVRVLEVDLRPDPGPIAVVGPLARVADVARVPAVADLGRDGVRPRFAGAPSRRSCARRHVSGSRSTPG